MSTALPTLSGVNWFQVLLEIGQDQFELVLPLQVPVHTTTPASGTSQILVIPVGAALPTKCGVHAAGPVSENLLAAHMMLERALHCM